MFDLSLFTSSTPLSLRVIVWVSTVDHPPVFHVAAPLEKSQSPNCPSFHPKMNFDQILSAIGGFGKYQKILYIWICLPQIPLAFHMMVSVFTGATPPHHCRGGSPDPLNQSLFPGSLSFNFSLSNSSCSSPELQAQGDSTERVLCGQGWVYSKETFQSTTVTEVTHTKTN